MHRIVNIDNSVIIKLAQRLELNYSNHQEEKIIPQHDRGTNYHHSGNYITVNKYIQLTIHLKFAQLYVKYISIFKN